MKKKALLVAACLLLAASSVAFAGGKPKPTPAPALCATTLIPTGTTYTQTDVTFVVTSWCGNMNVATIDTMSALNADGIKKILCFNKALPSTREPSLTCS